MVYARSRVLTARSRPWWYLAACLSHLSRSATETSGWAYTALPGTDEAPMTGIVDVAVDTGPDGTVWALALRVLDWCIYYTWASTTVRPEPGNTPASCPSPAGLNKLQSGIDPAGNVSCTRSSQPRHRRRIVTVVSACGSRTLTSSAPSTPHSPAWTLPTRGCCGIPGILRHRRPAVLTLTSKNAAEWHQQTSGTEFEVHVTTTQSPVAALLWVSSFG